MTTDLLSEDNHEAISRDVVSTFCAPSNAMGRSVKLKYLRLESMDFQETGRRLADVLPFEDLAHLHLYQCESTGVLCEALSRLELNLQSFCVEQPFNFDRRPSGAVDAFIRSLPPLRQLRFIKDFIGWETDIEQFDWTALKSHAPTLRCLDLDDFRERAELFIDTTRNFPDFLDFCRSASDLQQLSIIGPKMEKAAWSSPYGLYTLLVGFSNHHPSTRSPAD